MAERHADELARVKECEQQARGMMTAAANAKTEEAKGEFLRLASEWLKLATAISKRLADL